MTFSEGDRLRNFTVALSNHAWPPSPGFLSPQDYVVCHYYSGSSKNGQNHVINCQKVTKMMFRYVYLFKEDSDEEPLTLCEVEVLDTSKLNSNVPSQLIFTTI